jgi:hypothetical protein
MSQTESKSTARHRGENVVPMEPHTTNRPAPIAWRTLALMTKSRLEQVATFLASPLLWAFLRLAGGAEVVDLDQLHAVATTADAAIRAWIRRRRP